MASITGIMGITFVIMLFNYLAADFVRAWGFRKAAVRGLLRMKEARRLCRRRRLRRRHHRVSAPSPWRSMTAR